MTRVDFYILSSDKSSRDKFACVLTGKALVQGQQVYIHTESRESAALIDDLLWTFRDISFIPHSLAQEAAENSCPVSIGWNGTTPNTGEILINLGLEIPAFVRNFTRVMEIVVTDEESRRQSRDRYRSYRDMGFKLHSHELESDHAYI